ncbi:MAG: hypothetical protein ABIG96_06530 [Candidatus Micrarchaeota archaeon]
MAPYEETLLPEEEYQLKTIADQVNPKKKYGGLVDRLNSSRNTAEIAFIARLLKESIDRDLSSKNLPKLRVHPSLAESVHDAIFEKWSYLAKNYPMVTEHRLLLLEALGKSNMLCEAALSRKSRVLTKLAQRRYGKK